MAGRSNIEWTDATWNPIVGCSIVSPGCTNCYAMKMAARIEKMAAHPHYAGTTELSKAGAVWTGKVAKAPDRIFDAPLHWRKPRKIFVNSMGDLFHESIPDDWIDNVFAIMALAPQHIYQILTKRADRMRRYIEAKRARAPEWIELAWIGAKVLLPYEGGWPTFVWLGVSAERQQEADERIPHLLNTPAAVRFISAEPLLLGPIDFEKSGAITRQTPGMEPAGCVDWMIVGGESGSNARPMHPDWAREIRDQCEAAGIAFFFKQWGEWAPGECNGGPQVRTERVAEWFGDRWDYSTITPKVSEEMHTDDAPDVWRFGKKIAGRLLDGKEHNAFPNPRPSSLEATSNGLLEGGRAP